MDYSVQYRRLIALIRSHVPEDKQDMGLIALEDMYVSFQKLLDSVDDGIQRVRKLHFPDEEWSQNGFNICAECETHYPCTTILALDGEQ